MTQPTTAERITLLREYIKLIEVELCTGTVPLRLVDVTQRMTKLIEDADPVVRDRLLRSQESILNMNTLSPAEQRVALLLKQGDANAAVASKLGVSEATVKAHIKGITRKLGLNNRTQIAVAVHTHLERSVTEVTR